MAFDGERHIPFQDAVLFDMLLDQINNKFVPYQRQVEDASRLQVEVLEAMEQEQKKAERDSAVKSEDL
jgi:hypothetical protein